MKVDGLLIVTPRNVYVETTTEFIVRMIDAKKAEITPIRFTPATAPTPADVIAELREWLRVFPHPLEEMTEADFVLGLEAKLDELDGSNRP